jgi:hypothetical protein
MEGMSTEKAALTNARTYFFTVATDRTTTLLERIAAARAYNIHTEKNKQNHPNEDKFAKSAYNFYNTKNLITAKAYSEAANAANSQATNAIKFNAAYSYWSRLPINAPNYKEALDKCYTLAFRPDSGATPLRKFTLAKDYYNFNKTFDVAVKYRDTSLVSGSGANNSQKYNAAKALYDETIKRPNTNPNTKYNATKALYDAVKIYGNDKQKYDSAILWFTSAETNEQKYEAALGIYNVATTSENKYNAATKMFNAATPTNKYNAATKMFDAATPINKYNAATKMFDAATSETNKYNAATKMFDTATSETNKYNAAVNVYKTALPRNNRNEQYDAAKNLLTYIEKTGKNKNTSFHTNVAKTQYLNRPLNENIGFKTSNDWFQISSQSNHNKIRSARTYYNNSLTPNISCKNKCLAAKAYQHNSNALTDYHIYKTLMGENCERDVSSCPLPTQTDGFQNREPMTQCQQNTQSTSFTVARDAYNAYDTTPNQKYTKLSTMDLYFTSANEPNSGLNTNDKMNVAKTRLEYMLTLTYVEPPKKLAAARDYYNASLKLDCGNDISYNQYSAIKTYYEVANDIVNQSEKRDLSKQYYNATVRANRPAAEQYTVAKIWYANSKTSDNKQDLIGSAKEVYRTAILNNSGADDDAKQNAIIAYRNILKDNGILERNNMKELWPAIYDYMNKTNQPSDVKFAEADLAYRTFTQEGFDFATDCSTVSDPTIRSACVGYKNATTAERKLEYAQNWSGINYQRDIVDKRKELDNELSKLDNNAAVQIQKMNLDTTIMMNIAATVLASSLIVFSITKL